MIFEPAAWAIDAGHFVADAGGESGEAVVGRVDVEVVGGVPALRVWIGAKAEQAEVAAGEALGRGVKIIDRAQDPVLARFVAQWRAVGTDRDVGVRTEEGTIAMRRQFEFERIGGQANAKVRRNIGERRAEPVASRICAARSIFERSILMDWEFR